MSVPCGTCVGCCTSSYSILLRPSDLAALDEIPARHLSGAPGLPYPHAKMNPLPDGRCPMFVAGKCAIYPIRPQTCLDYDCRVFAAAGIGAGEDRPVIDQRVKQWRFSYASTQAQREHEAVREAAAFITRHAELFPEGWAPTSLSGVAVLAVKVYAVFLEDAPPTTPETIAQNIVNAARLFDTGA